MKKTLGIPAKHTFYYKMQNSAAKHSDLLAVSISDTASSVVHVFRSNFAFFVTKLCFAGLPLYFLLVLFFQTSLSFAAFSDVPADNQYVADIQYLEQIGAVKGEIFQPEKQITREVFAKWLLVNAGFKNDKYKQQIKAKFPDVKNKTYAPYIYRLVDLGLVNPEKELFFKPQDPVKTYEAISWIFFAEGIPVPRVFDTDSFQSTDVNKNSAIAPIIHKAIQLGMLAPGKTNPYRKITRGQAAHFLKLSKDAGLVTTINIVSSSGSDMDKTQAFEILDATWEKIFQTYLHKEKIDKNQAIYSATEGLVKELKDKYSEFERPGDNAILDSLSGQIEGIGAIIQMKEEEVEVVSPIVGSPAERAGILAKDIITNVDDVSVKGLKLSEVANRIKGKKGTQVKLTIKRNGKVLTFTITRDVVKIVSVTLERTDDNIAKISLNTFGENTTEEFNAIVEELVKEKPKAIVLDLRNNPGGFLETAVDIAGHFIQSGKTVTTVKYPNREDPQFSKGKAELAGIPTAVIVNAGSASASEILAGALKDYGLATIVGEKTFGKGTVQEVTSFTDGSTLKLTIAEWLTPNGHSIEKNGVTPDTEVVLSDADRTAKKDPQMDKALELMRK